jgi:hypothetical protein
MIFSSVHVCLPGAVPPFISYAMEVNWMLSTNRFEFEAARYSTAYRLQQLWATFLQAECYPYAACKHFAAHRHPNQIHFYWNVLS